MFTQKISVEKKRVWRSEDMVSMFELRCAHAKLKKKKIKVEKKCTGSLSAIKKNEVMSCAGKGMEPDYHIK